MEGGTTLSAAMKQYDKVFDPLYYNMVEAGETGGILDTILQRLSSYIEKNVKLKRAVQSATIYPIAVMSIAARRHHFAAVEGGSDFHHLVQRLGRRSAAAHPHRDRLEQFRRQHLRLDDRRCSSIGRLLRREVLVWHAAKAGSR